MSLDFTLEIYKLLLDALKDYEVYTVKRYLEERPSRDFVILRHDVDRMPKNALRMAELEAERGILSTYYFRIKGSLDIENLKAISNLTHEVGYHYEVLGKTKGDKQKAIQLFQDELKLIRSVCEVKTISRHGKPLSRYDDEALWDDRSFETYGIIGDAGISISGVPYYTDSGRAWDGTNSIRDLPTETSGGSSARTSYDLIDILKTGLHQGVYINTHPERWSENFPEWCFRYCIDTSFNLGKKIIKYTRNSG